MCTGMPGAPQGGAEGLRHDHAPLVLSPLCLSPSHCLSPHASLTSTRAPLGIKNQWSLLLGCLSESPYTLISLLLAGLFALTLPPGAGRCGRRRAKAALRARVLRAPCDFKDTGFHGNCHLWRLR